MVREQETRPTSSAKPAREKATEAPRFSPRKKKKEAESSSVASGEPHNARVAQTPISKSKQQRARKKLSLWRRSHNKESESSQIIGADDLRELLDIVTTRMRATEGLMGQSMQEDQLISIVREVLQSRQEADSASSLSGSLSKCDERSGTASADSGDTSLQQLVVVLMALLIQQRNLPEPSAPSTGVPTIVMTNFDDISQSSISRKSTFTEQLEPKDEDALSLCGASANNESMTLKSKNVIMRVESTELLEKPEALDGVEYTVEELHSVLSLIRAVQEADDDESTIWSSASTMEASIADDPFTMDSMLDRLISILPQSFGLHPTNDYFLDTLDEESDSDNDTHEDDITVEERITTFDEQEDAENETDAKTNHNDCIMKGGATDAVMDTNDETRETNIASSSYFFDSLWGGGNNWQTSARVVEKETNINVTESPSAEISINRNSDNAAPTSVHTEAQNSDGLFSGIFGSGATSAPKDLKAETQDRALAMHADITADASFLGAVFGSSVAAMFTGAQSVHAENRNSAKAKYATRVEHPVVPSAEGKNASRPIVNADRGQSNCAVSRPDLHNRKGTEDDFSVQASPYMLGLCDPTDGHSFQSEDSSFDGMDRSLEVSCDENTVNTFVEEEEEIRCDNHSLGSGVTLFVVENSGFLEERPCESTPTTEVAHSKPDTNEEEIPCEALYRNENGLSVSQIALSNLCRQSDTVLSNNAINSSLDIEDGDCFLQHVNSLDDDEIDRSFSSTAMFDPRIVFNGNESTEAACDRFEHTLADEEHNAIFTYSLSRSVPTLSKNVFLKHFGSRRESKVEKKQRIKIASHASMTLSAYPIDAPEVHPDLTIVSVPLSVDGSNEVNTSTLDDSTEGAWDHVEYTVDDSSAIKSSDAAGSTVSNKKTISRTSSSLFKECSTEILSKRSSSDLSLKSGGSLRSAMSRTHNFASSIASLKSAIVKNPMNKPAPDFAAAKGNTQEDASPPFAMKAGYRQRAEPDEENATTKMFLNKAAPVVATANRSAPEEASRVFAVRVLYQTVEPGKNSTGREDQIPDQLSDASNSKIYQFPRELNMVNSNAYCSDPMHSEGLLLDAESVTTEDYLDDAAIGMKSGYKDSVKEISVVDAAKNDLNDSTAAAWDRLELLHTTIKDCPHDEAFGTKLKSEEDMDTDVSIFDAAKNDLDDSTEAAWDRLELPLDEISKRISPESKRNTDEAPSKTNGFNRWMSRRASLPTILQNTGKPGNKSNLKMNRRWGVVSRATPNGTFREIRRQQRKDSVEGEEGYSPKEPESPIVKVSVVTKQEAKTQVQPVVTPQSKNLKQGLVEQNNALRNYQHQHPEMSFTLDDDEINKVQSTTNVSVITLDTPDSQWNEEWYTKYIEAGEKSDAIRSDAVHTSSSAASFIGATTQGRYRSITPATPSASSIAGSVAFTESCKAHAIKQETVSPKLQDWESFSESLFNEPSSAHGTQTETTIFATEINGFVKGDMSPSADFWNKSATKDIQRKQAQTQRMSTKATHPISLAAKRATGNSMRETRMRSVSTKVAKPTSILKKSKSELERWKSRKVLETERPIGGRWNSQQLDFAQSAESEKSSQKKVAVVPIKQRAREAAQRASTRSYVKNDGIDALRVPTPQKSYVPGGEQWKFFNPDVAPERTTSRGEPARSRNFNVDQPIKNGQKSSPSAVNGPISPFEDKQFTLQFGDDSAFDGDMSFPPF